MVHVDGDVIGYRAGYAAEHTLYHVHYKVGGKQKTKTFDGAKEYKAFLEEREFGPLDYLVETEVVVEDEKAALYNVRSIIQSIADDLQVDPETELRVYLTGPNNYRSGVATIKPYKGNRDPNKKPVHAPAIKEYMRGRYNAIVSDGQEADDEMAIAHLATPGWETESVIATIDKDLDTIPGRHYNFVTKEAYYIDEAEARKFFWCQMIAGDPVDNVPGIPGMGMVKAKKYLADWDGIDERIAYDKVRALYVQSYGDKSDEALLEMGRLLYIRRRPDEWWQPPELI